MMNLRNEITFQWANAGTHAGFGHVARADACPDEVVREPSRLWETWGRQSQTF
jgi:hypothetical protein